jgi:hypothetical protein
MPPAGRITAVAAHHAGTRYTVESPVELAEVSALLRVRQELQSINRLLNYLMPINADKPHLWKADTRTSVDQFNQWFMKFAPKAYRDTCKKTIDDVEKGLSLTKDLATITPDVLEAAPECHAWPVHLRRPGIRRRSAQGRARKTGADSCPCRACEHRRAFSNRAAGKIVCLTSSNTHRSDIYGTKGLL